MSIGKAAETLVATLPESKKDEIAKAKVESKVCCIKTCDLPVLAIGLCNKHWRRTRNYGSPAVLKWQSGAMKGLNVADRFWLQLKKTPNCWLWSGATDHDGYGIFSGSIGGVIFKKAHRFSYTLQTGEVIPSDMVVMHSCDNPRCVNPDHLSLGTSRENMLDKIAKGRANTPRSVLSPVPSLSAEQRLRIAIDPRPYAQIAVDFGVSGAVIGQIRAQDSALHFEQIKSLANDDGDPCVVKGCDHANRLWPTCLSRSCRFSCTRSASPDWIRKSESRKTVVWVSWSRQHHPSGWRTFEFESGSRLAADPLQRCRTRHHQYFGQTN